MDVNQDDNTIEPTECNICNKIIYNSGGDDVPRMVMTPCNHTFCTDCFFKWIHENPTCAICRGLFVKSHEEVMTEKLTALKEEYRLYVEYKNEVIKKISEEKMKFNGVCDEYKTKIMELERDLLELREEHDTERALMESERENIKSEQSRAKLEHNKAKMEQSKAKLEQSKARTERINLEAERANLETKQRAIKQEIEILKESLNL